MSVMKEIGPVAPPVGQAAQVPRNWLQVRLKTLFRTREWVPTGFRVELQKTEGGVDHVVLQDDVIPGLKGQEATIAHAPGGGTRLVDETPKLSGATVTFDYSLSDLVHDVFTANNEVTMCRGAVKVQATENGAPIELTASARFAPKMKWLFLESPTLKPNNVAPASPPYSLFPRKSDLGLAYAEKYASLAHSWFLIGYMPDRSFNLHVGLLSHGCVSVETYQNWDTICALLMRCRGPGGRYVGFITVTEHP